MSPEHMDMLLKLASQQQNIARAIMQLVEINLQKMKQEHLQALATATGESARPRLRLVR